MDLSICNKLSRFKAIICWWIVSMQRSKFEYFGIRSRSIFFRLPKRFKLIVENSTGVHNLAISSSQGCAMKFKGALVKLWLIGVRKRDVGKTNLIKSPTRNFNLSLSSKENVDFRLHLRSIDARQTGSTIH